MEDPHLITKGVAVTEFTLNRCPLFLQAGQMMTPDREPCRGVMSTARSLAKIHDSCTACFSLCVDERWDYGDRNNSSVQRGHDQLVLAKMLGQKRASCSFRTKSHNYLGLAFLFFSPPDDPICSREA
jgi:hypothetical protein